MGIVGNTTESMGIVEHLTAVPGTLSKATQVLPGTLTTYRQRTGIRFR